MNEQANQARFGQLAADFPALNAFALPLELVTHLHGPAPNTNQVPTPDEALGALIRSKSADSVREVAQDLLILAFVPAIHRTYREVCVGFPNLPPEDVAQQVLTLFLEIAGSNAIERRSSHLSVAIMRAVRKLAFRWAMKEARQSNELEPMDRLDSNPYAPVVDGSVEDSCVLQQFLSHCCQSGVLSDQQYELLTKVKLEGFRAKEITGTSGELSPTGVHNRLWRIMKRLRARAL